MKKNTYIAGAPTILTLSFLMLLAQLALLWQFYANQGPTLFALQCLGGVADGWANYCWIPRWVCLISSTFHFMCAITSVVAYKRMGRRWWYIALPLASVFAMMMVAFLIPLVYAQTAK